MANKIAPDGQVFVCAACGKRSEDKYGYLKIDQGWDESCMLHAVLCYSDSLEFHNHRVVKAKAVKEQ